MFAVTDLGPGIPPDVKDKVFDWFESHSNGSRHRGAGLGLPLVQSFVELHGGKVRVEFDRRQGHDRHLRFPDRPGRASQRRGMTNPSTFSLALPNETATANLMADLALLIGPGDVITLSGDLGAGKTAAARAMIRYLAGDDALEVPSPTFTLAQSYDLPPFPLIHADLYRINDATELEEIGLSPLPEGVVALIEWPERAPVALCRRTGSTSHSAIARRWDRRRAPPRSPAMARPPRRSQGWRRCGNSSTAPASSTRNASACPATPRRDPMRGCCETTTPSF